MFIRAKQANIFEAVIGMLEKSVTIEVESVDLPLVLPMMAAEEALHPATIAILTVGGSSLLGGLMYMLTHKTKR